MQAGADRGRGHRARSDARRGRGRRAPARRRQARRARRRRARHRRDGRRAGALRLAQGEPADPHLSGRGRASTIAEATIPDGVTCEVDACRSPPLRPRACRARRSPSRREGKLGVRTVDADGKVAFVPVAIDRGRAARHLGRRASSDGAKVIVQGQEFVKEGELVEAVPPPPAERCESPSASTERLRSRWPIPSTTRSRIRG